MIDLFLSCITVTALGFAWLAPNPLDAADEAQLRGWTVVDMKRDWNVIYPPRDAVAR